jgi:hypothetical protein
LIAPEFVLLAITKADVGTGSKQMHAFVIARK